MEPEAYGTLADKFLSIWNFREGNRTFAITAHQITNSKPKPDAIYVDHQKPIEKLPLSHYH